jgi:formylglycine-generating enzyme required for sulfatase activity
MHPAIELGETPIEERQVVAGEYLLRLAPRQRDTLTLLVDVPVRSETRVRRTLLPRGGGWDGMVLVERGPSPMEPSGSPVPGFLIDRHEVTNAEFGKFVAAGGYRDSTYWPQTLLVDHRRTPWRQAVRGFVDRTGLPGPRGWSSGTFAPDRANHPVTGVSWYEAAAYASWVGKELPSRAQWYRAALGDRGHVYPWGRDARSAARRANFNLAGTSPVGSFPLGVSPFGCFDMAGNVREWLRDQTTEGRRHFAAGGSWEDPAYMFFADHLEPFDPMFAGPGLGLRLVTRVPTNP